jgi:hypothetical protein
LECVERFGCDMRSKRLVGDDLEDSYQENKMSKSLMKLSIQKNINRQIHRENSDIRMPLKDLEEEK